MTEKKDDLVTIFESSDVTTLVGIPSVNLNSFIERGLYGISPSVRAGGGRGGRRLFGEADVFGIGLVWWLFEAGLRSSVIQWVLNQTSWDRQATANFAARELIKGRRMGLVVERSFRGTEKDSRVYSLDALHVLKLDPKNSNSVLVIPIGNLFAGLRKAISEFRR